MEVGISSSSENSDIDRFSRQRIIEMTVSERQANHVVHRMFNTTKVLYNDDFAKTIHSHIKQLRSRKPQLPGENWQNILEMFNDYIADPERPKEVSSQLENDFKLTITKMYDNEQEKIGLVDAERARKEVEKAREEAREEARKEVEKAREEARKEVEKKYAALAERYAVLKEVFKPDIEKSQSELSPKLEQPEKSSHSSELSVNTPSRKRKRPFLFSSSSSSVSSSSGTSFSPSDFSGHSSTSVPTR